MSKGKRKFWIAFNLISVILFASYSQIFISSGINKGSFLIAGVFLLQVLLSFQLAFWKNNLWQLTHKPFNQLDEREAQVSGNATRIAYAIFTIFSLSIFVILSVLELRVSIVLAISLIYLAHILPACIIGFK